MPESTPPASTPPGTNPPEPLPEASDAAAPDPEAAEEPAPPLNRAERRKQARQQPGHVGPQLDPTRRSRGPRPHTKRARG